MFAGVVAAVAAALLTNLAVVIEQSGSEALPLHCGRHELNPQVQDMLEPGGRGRFLDFFPPSANQ